MKAGQLPDLRVTNETRQRLLMSCGWLANTFWTRFRGLMGREGLDPDEGLILAGDKSIHTFFMRFPIDVVYVDHDWRVIRADVAMRPNRIGPFVRNAAFILELPAGVIEDTETGAGDQLLMVTDIHP